jgi:hypothetical protein
MEQPLLLGQQQLVWCRFHRQAQLEDQRLEQWWHLELKKFLQL